MPLERAAAAKALVAQPIGEPLDYNPETAVDGLGFSIEFSFAALFVLLIASVPGVLGVLLRGDLTPAHKVESVCLLIWLISMLYLFTNVIEFNSSHFSGSRPLTLVEAVYLLAQIITTVGYGDIVPANPKGQVWVAINVLLALCLYGSLIMEVATLIGERLRNAFVSVLNKYKEECPEADHLTAEMAKEPLQQWDVPVPHIDKTAFTHSALAFVVCAAVGATFYHYYPGEGKTWLQAVYMSVITLSTVGFGWFTASTESGKIFGAFWMVCGVGALAAMLSSFVELMFQIKATERWDEAHQKVRFYRLVKLCTRPITSLGDFGMDAYDFLKFGVLLRGLASEDEVRDIESRFEELADDDGMVDCDKVEELEGPPKVLLGR